MSRFWLEVVRRATAEMLAAKGTTMLGGVIIPVRAKFGLSDAINRLVHFLPDLLD